MPSSPPPNIILLCPDEMKATALGAYGNRSGATPFLDRLAARSVVFEQCHTVHPKCTPSRCALVSAQYPHVGGHRTLELPLRAHEINLIKELRQAGYETVLCGKNHVVPEAQVGETFDRRFTGTGRVDFVPKTGSGFPAASHYIGRADVPLEEFNDRTLTRQAMAYLGERKPDRPFFLWLNWNSPHPPYSIPEPYFGRTPRDRVDLPPADDSTEKPPYQARLQREFQCDRLDENGWRELAATYLDMCRFVDDQVEAIYETLRTSGLLENTLLVFWSDHGDFAGEHRLPEKWDTAFYDCITRVPLMLSGPGLDPKAISALVESIDILPTVLTLAGVRVPPGIQGKCLTELICGRVDAVRREVFCQGGQEPGLLARTADPATGTRPAVAYWHKQKALFSEPGINARAKMIRDLRFKYCFHAGGFEELYDLASDPHELLNLARRPAWSGTMEQYRIRLIEKLIEVETVEPFQPSLNA